MAIEPRNQVAASSLGASELLREKAFVGGQWIDASERIVVTNPADGTTVGTVPDLGAEATELAVRRASTAFEHWKAQLPQTRAGVLRDWSRLVREHAADLARLMTLEQGKPLREAEAEIAYAASFIEWFAEEARRGYGRTIPSHRANAHLRVTAEPIGVTASITPWNFPTAMVARKAAAALAAGCPMVVRPASETPFSALALAALAEVAGAPSGTLSVITGSPEPIFDALAADAAVRAVSFTGSTEVGRKILTGSAHTVKRVSLELGGHAPFIVFGDAPVARSVALATAAKFTTGGQDCLAANRIYVHSSVYDEFVTRFTAATEALVVGNGLDPATDVGPLIHERAVQRASAHVADAVRHGATATTGGDVHALGGNFFAPTVLADVGDSMLVAREETFAPVAPVLRFDDEDEVVARANATEYGLAAYVLTESLSRAERVSSSLQYGMVGVNTAAFTGAPIPFGGMKQSGLGREGGTEGMYEYLELKYVCIGGIDDE